MRNFNEAKQTPFQTMQDIVKNSQAKKIEGKMVDTFTASAITQAYAKVNDKNKKRIETSNLSTLVNLAHKIMGGGSKNEATEMNESMSPAMFADLKKGDRLQIKFDSPMAKGNSGSFVVSFKSKSKKYNLEKVTLTKDKKGPGVKYYLYNRNGKVSMAQGDMAVSLTNVVKESTENKEVIEGSKIVKKALNPDKPLTRRQKDKLKRDARGKICTDIHNRSLMKEAFKVGDYELEEGTWKMPKNNKQIAPLMKLMKKPIKLGKDGDAAIDVIEPYIGDDELYDDLYDAGKKNPNGDARPIIKDALRRFGFKEEVSVDELSTKTLQSYSDKSWKNKKRSKGVKTAAGKIVKKALMKEAFKVGDFVLVNTGPHKGEKHEIIHVKPGGGYNVIPVGLMARDIKYKLGAAGAKASNVSVWKESVEQVDEGKVGIYRKSNSPAYDGEDAHNSARHTLVKRAGKHLTFKNEAQAKAWIKKNTTAGKEFLFRKVSKSVKESVEQIDELTDKQKAEIAKRKAMRQGQAAKKKEKTAAKKAAAEKKKKDNPNARGEYLDAADKGLIMQLRSAEDISNEKEHPITFRRGKTEKVPHEDVKAVLSFHDALKKPDDKRRLKIQLAKGGATAAKKLADVYRKTAGK